MAAAAPDLADTEIVEIGRASRLEALDVVRGLIVVVMALDHVRDYFSEAGFDPLDLARTTPAYYVTRWVTHFCAPGFSFFAGTGAFLSMARGKSKRDLAWFLFTRGLFLILFESVVLRFVWQFNVLPYTFFATLSALGAAMIILAPLVILPVEVVGVIGVAIIALHNALDPINADAFGSLGWIWMLLHQGGDTQAGPLFIHFGYPLIPWAGVMAAGFAFGKILLAPPGRRRRIAFGIGLFAVAAFVVLRALNVYGDPARWSKQKSPLFTAFSFLNVEKYPPSLLFLLVTLGPLLMLLAAVDRPPARLSRLLAVFGRVPLFFYASHILVIHILAVLVARARSTSLADPYVLWTIHDAPTFMGTPPPGYGFGLVGVYVIWILVVLALYPACAWYGEKKAREKKPWMSYF